MKADYACIYHKTCQPGGRFLGLVLLFSLENGSLLAILPDGIIQRLRVGASSALATRAMARADARTVQFLRPNLAQTIEWKLHGHR